MVLDPRHCVQYCYRTFSFGWAFRPLLVLASWAIGKPMTLVFSDPLDLFAIAGAALIVNAIASDGETPWFEGLLLVGVYVLLALAFFFTG